MEPFDGSVKKSIVLLDNTSVNHTAEVKEAFDDAGMLLIFLPTYNKPIEVT